MRVPFSKSAVLLLFASSFTAYSQTTTISNESTQENPWTYGFMHTLPNQLATQADAQMLSRRRTAAGAAITTPSLLPFI